MTLRLLNPAHRSPSTGFVMALIVIVTLFGFAAVALAPQ